MLKLMWCRLADCVTWMRAIQIPAQTEDTVVSVLIVPVDISVFVQTLTQEEIVVKMLMSVLQIVSNKLDSLYYTDVYSLIFLSLLIIRDFIVLPQKQDS